MPTLTHPTGMHVDVHLVSLSLTPGELIPRETISHVLCVSTGTRQTDANGKPIPSYKQAHVEAFARAWTGFDVVPMRGNIAQVVPATINFNHVRSSRPVLPQDFLQTLLNPSWHVLFSSSNRDVCAPD